ncbi:uncharacterized protein TRIREDRAFT_122903 [Trichoderma reesei QM6a]|uniref:Predicted protein n=2 Tax=Hypocrea jecorina TaxID=51453 RepID=G0RPI8_HYPJQ|nr:uncharacterized protein TRIREDRAFT_122903 [Trichoderma reesei QM6a]EGR46754.1 predicted protein [Trichoderma reesei QM6a]ETS00425.1 DUF1690-domain-containing protein [Trichoderma reesei RUT C-30]
MGAQESKPQGLTWKISGPPSVSLPVLETLQTSPETDASRAKLVEQHIQARVAEELKRLEKQESDALKLAHEKIAEAASSSEEDKGPSRYTVGKEIEELRKKLEQRKKVRDLPESVDAARNSVIRCLRENDRKPLVCYDEVEAFKAEVKKMEREWINRITA